MAGSRDNERIEETDNQSWDSRFRFLSCLELLFRGQQEGNRTEPEVGGRRGKARLARAREWEGKHGWPNSDGELGTQHTAAAAAPGSRPRRGPAAGHSGHSGLGGRDGPCQGRIPSGYPCVVHAAACTSARNGLALPPIVQYWRVLQRSVRLSSLTARHVGGHAGAIVPALRPPLKRLWPSFYARGGADMPAQF